MWVSKCMIDTHERTMLSSRVVNVVSGRPGVSDCINDRLGNVFLKRLRTGFNHHPILKPIINEEPITITETHQRWGSHVHPGH